jgi:hypothetical protein
MYLTYSKSLPMFDQHMVQLESDKPDDSKVYVEFQEGFIPLAAKYYEALSAPVVVVEEVPVVDYVDPAPVPVHTLIDPVVFLEEVPVVDVVRLSPVEPGPTPVEPVVVLEEVPVVDVVRPSPVPVPTPVVSPAEQVVDPAPVAKKARKTSV